MNRSRGFTLIELMITIAIIAVLLTVALPTYKNHILKTNRSDAKAALVNAAAKQEKYFFRANKYSSNLATDLNVSTTSPEGHYTLSVALNAGSDEFTLTATARGDQLDDTSCRTFTLDYKGTKTAKDSSSTNNDDCW